jgi:hypothetical protein
MTEAHQHRPSERVELEATMTARRGGLHLGCKAESIREHEGVEGLHAEEVRHHHQLLIRGIPEQDRERAVELRERLRRLTIVALGHPREAMVEIAEEVHGHTADEKKVAIGAGPYHRDGGGTVEGGEPSESARGDVDHMRGLC